MIVELVIPHEIDLEIEGYRKIVTSKGVFYVNIDDRVDTVVKKHPVRRVSIFTDRGKIIKQILEKTEIIDIHVK